MGSSETHAAVDDKSAGQGQSDAVRHSVVNGHRSQPASVELGLHQRKDNAKDNAPDSGLSRDIEAADDSAKPTKDAEEVQEFAQVEYIDLVKQFSLLGWTAFGGPAAHIGLFQRVRCDVAGSIITAPMTMWSLQAAGTTYSIHSCSFWLIALCLKHADLS